MLHFVARFKSCLFNAAALFCLVTSYGHTFLKKLPWVPEEIKLKLVTMRKNVSNVTCISILKVHLVHTYVSKVFEPVPLKWKGLFQVSFRVLGGSPQGL